jgi:hypothetical protein
MITRFASFQTHEIVSVVIAAEQRNVCRKIVKTILEVQSTVDCFGALHLQFYFDNFLLQTFRRSAAFLMQIFMCLLHPIRLVSVPGNFF